MRRPEPGKMTVLRLGQSRDMVIIAAFTLIAEKELDSLSAVIVNMKNGNEIEKITHTKL